MSELEARKRALVTESEICRENLKAALADLKAYGDGFLHKVDRVRSFGPWLMLSLPAAFSVSRLFSRRKAQPEHHSHRKGIIATALLAWRLYRRYGPVISSVLRQLAVKRSGRGGEHASV